MAIRVYKVEPVFFLLCFLTMLIFEIVYIHTILPLSIRLYTTFFALNLPYNAPNCWFLVGNVDSKVRNPVRR